MNCVVVGARERQDSEKDRKVVEDLIMELVTKYGMRFTNIISVGCDKGVGRYAREFCITQKIIFVEVRMKLEGPEGMIPRSFFIHVFQARNPALLALGDEFYIFKGKYEKGIIEELVEPATEKVSAERVKVWEYVEEPDSESKWNR